MNMIISLFSSFDPITSFSILNFTIIFFIFLYPRALILNNLPSRNHQNSYKIFLIQIENELKTSINNNNKKGKFNIINTIFIFILLLNLLGLCPYIFTISAQIIFTLSFAFPFWLSFILFRRKKNTNHFLRHLVPLRTPIALSQFIVIIERIRQTIRPITLSVRLAANITAGHILIGLCRNNINILNFFSVILLALIILELAVAFIQRYVFTVLTTIYMRETYFKSKPPLSYSSPESLTSFNRNKYFKFTYSNYFLNHNKKFFISFFN